MLTARVITLDGCQWQHNYANILLLFFIANNWGKGKGAAGRCESSCWLWVWLTVSEWVSLLAGKDVKALSKVNILHSSSALRVDAREQPIAFWWHIREGRYNINYCWKDQQPSVGTWIHPSVHKAESSWRKVRRHSFNVTLQIPSWKKALVYPSRDYKSNPRKQPKICRLIERQHKPTAEEWGTVITCWFSWRGLWRKGSWQILLLLAWPHTTRFSNAVVFGANCRNRNCRYSIFKKLQVQTLQEADQH